MTNRFELLIAEFAELKFFHLLQTSASSAKEFILQPEKPFYLYLSNLLIWTAFAMLAVPFWQSVLSYLQGYFGNQKEAEPNSEANETSFAHISKSEIRKTGLTFSALISVILLALGVKFLLAILVFAAINFVLPKILFFKAKENFKQQFDLALPDALMGLSASLHAGLTIQQALDVASKISAKVFANECEYCLKQYSVGVPIDKALDGIRKRVPTASSNMAFGALVIGRQLGGPLPLILKTISETIRERLRVEGRLNVLTAQGRSQGGVLCSAPILVGVGTAIWSPEKFAMLTDTPLGQLIFGIAIVLWVVGVVVTWKVMQLEV